MATFRNFIKFIPILFAFAQRGNSLTSLIAGRLYTERMGSSAVYDGQDSVFILGGYDTFSATYAPDVLKYNLTQRAVSRVGVFPTPPAYGAASVDRQGNIFYFGGETQATSNFVSTIWRLSWENPSPVPVGNLPVAKAYMAAVLGGEDVIYIIGGYSTTGPHSSILAFNTITYTVEVVANLPTATSSISASWVRNSIYILGGEGSGSFNTQITRYTPSTNAVEVLETVLSSGLVNAPAVTVGDSLYTVGGTRGGDFYIKKFNSTSGALEGFNLDENPPRYPYYLTTAVYVPWSNRIFVFGGKDIVNIHALDKVMYIGL